jgi:hypothetical protein
MQPVLCPQGAAVTEAVPTTGFGLIVSVYVADVPLDDKQPLAEELAVITPVVTEPTLGAVYDPMFPLPEALERSGPPRPVFVLAQLIEPGGFDVNEIPFTVPPAQTTCDEDPTRETVGVGFTVRLTDALLVQPFASVPETL